MLKLRMRFRRWLFSPLRKLYLYKARYWRNLGLDAMEDCPIPGCYGYEMGKVQFELGQAYRKLAGAL